MIPAELQPHLDYLTDFAKNPQTLAALTAVAAYVAAYWVGRLVFVPFRKPAAFAWWGVKGVGRIGWGATRLTSDAVWTLSTMPIQLAYQRIAAARRRAAQLAAARRAAELDAAVQAAVMQQLDAMTAPAITAYNLAGQPVTHVPVGGDLVGGLNRPSVSAEMEAARFASFARANRKARENGQSAASGI